MGLTLPRMSHATFFAILCIGMVCSSLAHAPIDNSRKAFDSWAHQYGRSYQTTAEATIRYEHFRSNIQAVNLAAVGSPMAQFGPNDFADWSPEEFSAQRPQLTTNFWDNASEQQQFSDQTVQAALAQGDIDWVAKGAVTTPISQGRCATCAQFSATANIEAQWHLSGHPLVPLAVQEMIDCSSYTGPYGMGWVSSVHHGIDQATDYTLANHSDPTLKGCRSPCDTAAANKSFAKIDGATCMPAADYSKVAGDNETQIAAWLQHGPLSISVAAGPLNGYKGGIISGQTCNTTQVDHAVLLVGSGSENGTAYWKLKNSWGPAFGEGGYFRVQRGVYCLGMRGTCQSYIGSPPSDTN